MLVNRININFYTNVLALVANVCVGIYYTPYLVNTLGLIAYGILPLALIINQYISIATQTFTHSFTRFYSVAIQQDNYDEASKDISTSLVVVLLISCLVIPLGLWISYNVDLLFQIPAELLTSAKYLFLYTILSFIVSMFSSLLNVTLYAINRLDLMNVLKIIRSIFKLIFVILFFQTIKVDVIYVGIANLLTELFVLLLSVIMFYRYKPSSLSISYTHFDKAVLHSIMAMSIWVLIQLGGDTLLYRTDNLVVNRYWGIEASGALGAISELGSYISVVISVIGSLFGPIILIAYAKDDNTKVKSLLVEQSTIVGCLSAILAGVIAGSANYVLNIWLGQGMDSYSWWLVVKMVVLPFYAAGGIMAFVYRAWNRVKFPAIGTIIIGVIDIVVLIAVCEIFKPDNAAIVLLIGAVFSLLQCYILNAIVVGKIYKDVKDRFTTIFIKVTLTLLASYIISKILFTVIGVSTLIQLALMLLSVGVVMFVITFFLIFTKSEREGIIQIIR